MSSEHHHPHHEADKEDLIRIALVGLAALITWLKPEWKPLSLLAIAAGGWPIYQHALRDLRRLRMTMELSMTLALGAALALGQLLTVLVIIFFVLVAEVLEGLTVERGHEALHDLLHDLPDRARVRRGSDILEVATSELEPGDHVLIRPGERLPVDGTVRAGHSFVEQASITGEALPVEKLPGAAVYAGTLNQAGALEVQVSQVGRETAFGRILEAVEQAEASRAPIQKLADRLAAYLVYVAVAAALLTYLWTRDALNAISVILVAGACGVAAGTPLALLGGMGRAARLGAVVKGSRQLEQLARVDTILLDKTGTLTLGEPQVMGVFPEPGVTSEELLSTAAAAESLSEHPLAAAIVKRAQGLPLPQASNLQALPGLGLRCEVEGEEVLVGNPALVQREAEGILVRRGARFLGSLTVEDALRPETTEAVRSLQHAGYRVILLTGDSERNARAVAAQLDISEVHAQVLPEDKQRLIQALRKQGRRIAMVGDGINDAPAMLEADVGIAMGSGTDLTRQSAGIILLGNDLSRLPKLLRLSRRCQGIILANFGGTLAVDAVGMLLAALGFLTPLLAALVHVGSELAFLLNSARLLPARRRL